MSKVKYGYICSEAWASELGHTDIKVYATEKELKFSESCLEGDHENEPCCTVVKVEIRECE